MPAQNGRLRLRLIRNSAKNNSSHLVIRPDSRRSLRFSTGTPGRLRNGAVLGVRPSTVGTRGRASPESITPSRGYGFRAHRFRDAPE
jgi:hypothetical protein